MIFRNRCAQVMLEYLVIAVIVMAAIMFGGPVLVNSIGARFKISEDNVGDAFSEKIKQAAPEVCACYPTSTNPATWPAISGCGAPCGALEMNRERRCPGCDPATEEKCAESRECCYPRVRGDCGSIDPTLEGTSVCSTRETPGGRCLDANGGVRGCLSNEASYTEACGENITKFSCVPDSNCIPNCVSETWTPDASEGCIGEDVDQTGNCGDTRKVPGTKAPACPPATSVACGEEIASTNECDGCTGTGTAGVNCPAGYECKDNGCVKKCWSILQTTDTGVVRFGDTRGTGGCASTQPNDNPRCSNNNQPFPGCPFGCNNDFRLDGDTGDGDRCKEHKNRGPWHPRKKWICADLDYQTLCYRAPCTSSNFSTTKDGWVNENGKCVK